MLLAAVVVMSIGAVANAQSFDQLIQQAKNEIRAAESAMHNGVNDESAKGVQAAAETLVKARAIDAENYKVGMQIGRVEDIRKTLETRTGKKIPLATDPGGAPAADTMPTDAEGLAQRASDLLRKATSETQNGRNEEAKVLLGEAAPIVAKLRETDATHRRLMALETDLMRQTETVTKRLAPRPIAPAVAEAAPADPTEAMAQKASDLLRQAEGEMHNGRNAEAKALLDEAAPMIANLKSVAPNHRRMMALETALARQSEVVDKRLAPPDRSQVPVAATATTPVGNAPTSVTAGTAAPATQAAAAPPGKLPYHTRNKVTFAGQNLGAAERHFRDLEAGTDGLDENTRLGRIEMSLQAVEEMLPGLAEQAASDGVSNDPRVTGVSKELTEMKAKLAELKSGAAERQAASAELQAGADSDVAALRELFDRLNNAYFSKANGTPIYFNTMDEPVALLDLIMKFEAEEQAKAQKAVDVFAKKYGNAVNESTGNQRASYPFDGIRNGIANIAKTRDAMATKLAQRSQDTIDSLPSLHDMYRVKNHDDARAWFRLAKAFNESNAAVKALDKTIEKQLRADLEAYVTKVEDKTWPGNSKGKEAKAGITFFENDPGWGSPQKSERTKGNEPLKTLGIHIRGDWSVQARNLEEDPTMYGIPAFVAVQSKTDKEMGLARVYSVTLRTRESRDPKMKPPFTSTTVGDSYYIQAKKVK
jgi:hypothetical protein